MQKLINILAVLSFGVSSAVVAGGAYVYLNRETIKDNIKQQALESIGELVGEVIGDQLTSALGGSIGSTAGEALGSDSAIPIPTIPF